MNKKAKHMYSQYLNLMNDNFLSESYESLI